MADPTLLSAQGNQKADLSVCFFLWSGLREQKQTTECCRLRSECAETRSVANKACLVQKHDYVSSARTPRNLERGLWLVQSPSITLQKIKPVFLTGLWSGLRGSNPPPPPWQGGALPNELNPQEMVPPVGIEPTTRGFSVLCSTN